jgi:putative addiction module component (TIGR02574 family)
VTVQSWADIILRRIPEPESRNRIISEDLTRQLLTLPLPERVELAQALWQSIDERFPDESSTSEEHEVIASALRRDGDLASGQVSGRTHEQVMEAVRRAMK